MEKTTKVCGNIVDVVQRRIYRGTLIIADGCIHQIEETGEPMESILIPGFIDAHIHIESTMVTPAEFGRVAVRHGTLAAVSDPHEIANVLGIEGIEYMLADAEFSPIPVYFSAPSCVPATPFETSGASLHQKELSALLTRKDIRYLGEMMNFPGVIFGDQEVHAKLNIARKLGKPIDGHAPLLTGPQLKTYAEAGITTDHECTSLEEALEKIELGIKILIREGTAAKNFEALFPLLNSHPEFCMLCSDDKHPDDLLRGHINQLVKRAVLKGCNLYDVLRAASSNAIRHYSLPIGQLQVGDSADFLVVDDLHNFNVQQAWLSGRQIMNKAGYAMPFRKPESVNRFATKHKQLIDFAIPAQTKSVQVIKVNDGSLLTERAVYLPHIVENVVTADLEHDILKLTVVNRYQDAPPALALVQGFGLQDGALATTVAHDSHNILAVATNDHDLLAAVNLLIDSQGGLAVVARQRHIEAVLPLPIAGLMSTDDLETTAQAYRNLDSLAHELGSALTAPFMTLSFMALLVIPELKLSDRGLFDGNDFKFTNLFIQDDI